MCIVDMKNMKNWIVKLLIILFTLSSLHLFAQKNSKEFSMYGGGGLSFFAYQAPMNFTSSIGYHGDVGVGFTGFVSQQCGFHIGAGLGLFNIKAKVGDLQTFTPDLTDWNERLYDLYTTLSGYSETHKTFSLNIPLMFQFQTKMKQGWNWKKSQKLGYYAMIGAKLHLLFNRTYDSQITTLYNAAYYPEADNWAATQTFAGLGDFVGKDTDGKLNVDVLAMFAFETGLKHRLNKNLYLYTGIYFDCGLNDPTKKYREPVGNYIFVKDLADLSLLEFYNNSFLMGIGIKLRLAFYKPPKCLPCR